MAWYDDQRDFDPGKITCHPRPPRERETPTHERAMRGYVKGLERYARRSTRRLRRKGRLPCERIVWGRIEQDAWLQAGWQPVSESTDPNGFTKMTMRLDP